MNNSNATNNSKAINSPILDRLASEPEVTPLPVTSTNPNIFYFASTELSQDAFLCWLLSWANADYAGSEPGLHECALRLIHSLIEKHGVSPPERIEKIEVHKQYYNIDVLCVVNDEIVILIEDKTDSAQHSGQLARYFKFAESQFSSHRILPIYFKTGDQSDYTEIVQDGYQVFSRQEFLRVLNAGLAGKINNAIFQDYREYLQSISDAVDSYEVQPIQDWGWSAWDGFFMKLQKELGTGDWDYVNNAGGGFKGFWWNWQPQENCEIYIQLEESKLCFKVEVSDPENRSSVRNFWHEEIMKSHEGYDLEVIRPARFGSGNIMTFAVLKSDYRDADDQGVLNLDTTIKTLRKAEMLLNGISSRATK